jgi:hypothetical protein
VYGGIGNDPTTGIAGGANLTRAGNPAYSTTLTAPGLTTSSVVFDGTEDVYFTNTVPSIATNNFGLEA